MKKIGIFAVIVIFITCLAGCGGGGSNDGEKAVTNPDILALFDKYEKAVEAYDVDKMLECLDSSSFTLTINEGSYTDSKDYSTLKTQLEDDEDNQVAWRKDAGIVTNGISGHNYKLDLVLGTAMSSNETSTGAVVKQTFEVWESSDEITAMKTDSGTIVWTLTQSSGEWKATVMTINYSTTTSAALVAKGLAVISTKDKGFGFSRVGF